MFSRYLTLLPDIYNYKPYWGKVQPGAYGKAGRERDGKPAIIHFHGPKLQSVMCALDRFSQNDTDPWKKCGMTYSCQTFPYIKLIFGHAMRIDGGEYYRETNNLFNKYLAGG